MGSSNSLRRAVQSESVDIRLPHLDARRRRVNEIGHPAPARRLLCMMTAMLKNGQPYREACLEDTGLHHSSQA